MASPSNLIEAFQTQAKACGELGSPFMERLLSHAATELEQSGSMGGLLTSWTGDPLADAVPLRLAAGLHALVLSGADPSLAACYKDFARTQDGRAIWRAALSAIDAHRARIETFLDSPPQTNEVGRAAVLLGGFLEIARATEGRPMRTLEIGASAGLNLFWDQYRYELGQQAQWGDPASSVTVKAAWTGPLPPLRAPVRVAARAASDTAPVALDDEEARLRLRAYVWADQAGRMDLLEAAIALVRHAGGRVEKGEAAAWISERLQQPAEGCTTVLYHSIAWEYFPDSTKRDIEAALQEAGGRATPAAPLAWLRLEPPAGSGPGAGQPELRLTLWPGGSDQRLAKAHTHGPPVTWLACDAGDA